MKKKWLYYIVIAVELVIAVLLTYKACRGDELLTTSLSQWQSSYFSFEDGKWVVHADDEFEVDTIDLVGPFVTLGRGSYVATIDYSADEDGVVVVNTGADNGYRLTSRDCVLHAQESVTNLEFETKGTVENIAVGIYYGGSGDLTVEDIKLYRTRAQERRALFFFVLISIAIDLIYVKRKWFKENKKIITILLAIVFISSIPLFSYGHGKGHDLEFHLMRIEGIKEELLAGRFPVKLQSIWNYGHSYPVSIYYGDLLLYIPALLRICGFNLLTVYKIYIGLINFITVIIAFFCGKHIWHKNNTAIVFSAAYTFATYRIVCLYVRSALGEFTSMAFFPLILLGIYELYFVKKSANKKINLTAFISLTLGMSAIVTSHILSTEMVCIALIIFAVIYWKKTFEKQILATIGLSAIATAFLTSWFTVPFLDYYKNVKVNINTVVSGNAQIQEYGAYITQYFSVFKTLFGGARVEIISMRLSLTPGLVLMVTMLVALGLWLYNRSSRQMNRLFFASLVILFVSSNIFPWDFISENRIGNILAQIQFPFRYLGFACLTLSVLLGLIFNYLEENNTDSRKYMMYGLLILVFIIQVGFDISSYSNNVVSIYNPQYVTDLSKDNIKEYFRADSDFEQLTFEVVGDEVESAELVTQNGADYAFKIKMNGAGSVTLPIMNYKGYEVTDDKGNSYEIFDGEQKEISISLPAGFSGTVRARFVEPIYWRAAEIISLLSVILFIMFFIKQNKQMSVRNKMK